MRTIYCAYCTNEARGYDVDDEPTCGDAECQPVVRGMPAVIEVTEDEDDEEEES